MFNDCKGDAGFRGECKKALHWVTSRQTCWWKKQKHPISSSIRAYNLPTRLLASMLYLTEKMCLWQELVVKSKKIRRKRIGVQPRVILISLAICNLLMELSVTTLSIYPILFKCWPYGRLVCQIQVSQFFFQFFNWSLSNTESSRQRSLLRYSDRFIYL